MTQPGGPIQLNTLFTRALRALGALTPGSIQLFSPRIVQPVQVIADVSDLSIPHSNPVFGFSLGAPAVVAEFSAVAITATSRLIRFRQLLVFNAVTQNSLFMEVLRVNPIDTITATLPAGSADRSMGPVGTDLNTSIITRGSSAIFDLTANSFSPEFTQFDMRPPLLLAPGSTLVIEDGTANQAIAVAALYEEIPQQDETADLGFPAS